MDVLWGRIAAYSGEVFHLLGGRSFTYSVSGDTVHVDTGNTDLARRQIETALDRMPLTDPDGTTTTHSPTTTPTVHQTTDGLPLYPDIWAARLVA
jgi:hypothetical protein